jgi:hypothetical protein
MSYNVVRAAVNETGLTQTVIRRDYDGGLSFRTGWAVAIPKQRMPLFGACLVRAAATDAELGNPGTLSDVRRYTEDVLLMLMGARIDGGELSDAIVLFPGWRLEG